jgi:hypothetical protein
MSNINATLQSNLVLPVVDSLPASGTVGTQFVYQNNVYVFDSGGLPVRVSPPPATAETFTFTLSGTFSDAGDVTTDNITATKLGNMVVINAFPGFTYDGGGILGVILNMTGIPAEIRPASGARVASVFFGQVDSGAVFATFAQIGVSGDIIFRVSDTQIAPNGQITATYFV